MRNIAVILAGGTGSRVGGDTPKQLLPLADGRSILEHSVDGFEQACCIDEIAIVMHPDWLAEAEKIMARNPWAKVKKIIPGGAERWESSVHAIDAYGAEEDCAIWLHDAARPFVSPRILADVAAALKENAAVTVAVPVTDTLYQVESVKVKGERTVDGVPDRKLFMRAQTPQAFHLATIREAYQRALAGGTIIATDDAGIVHAYMPEQPIVIVQGEEGNRKITFAEDLKNLQCTIHN